MLRLIYSGTRSDLARQKKDKEDRIGARWLAVLAAAGVLMAGPMMAPAARGQTSTSSGAAQDQTAPAPRASALRKIGPAALPTYDNRYELFGGLNFMNFQAGQSLPDRMNLGGGEIMATYWFNKRLGASADYRVDAGTTPVFANAGITEPTTIGSTGINNRPLVILNTGMLGGQYRGPKNQYVAVNYHALFGVSSGIFDASFRNILPGANPYAATGLYTNRVKPMAALGGSIDFNRSKNFAVRVSPDLILEHFGTETREFFGVSGGVIYRFGKVK